MYVLFRGTPTQCRRMVYQLVKRGVKQHHTHNLGYYSQPKYKRLGLTLKGLVISHIKSRGAEVLLLNHNGTTFEGDPLIYNKDRKRLLEMVDNLNLLK